MAAYCTWRLNCDACYEIVESDESTTKAMAVAYAKRFGWKIIGGKHYCRECAAELKAASA